MSRPKPRPPAPPTPPEPPIIDSVLVVVAQDEAGAELVPYIIDRKTGSCIPMVAGSGDADRIELLKTQAKWFAQMTRRPARLVMFTGRRVLETYRP